MTTFVTLLWHGTEPIGICVFVSPPISLAARNRFFGRSGQWNRTALKGLTRQLFLLQRVVLHPTYRGAGIASEFVRRSCQLCPVPWIETLSQLGRFHPFFEKAGFQRVGECLPATRSRAAHSRIYGGRRNAPQKTLVTNTTFQKSEFSSPIYYVFDNRTHAQRHGHRAVTHSNATGDGIDSVDG